MNRQLAKNIAQTITNEQLKQMFDRAKELIADWTVVSNVNKSFTKGVAWNILGKDFDVNKTYHILAKINMIREFWEFLPNELKQKEKKSKNFQKPFHQNPEF
jgi:hypothetical protein